MVHFGGTVSQEQFDAAMRLMLGKQPHGRSMLVSAIFFAVFAIIAGATLGMFAGIVVAVLFVLPAATAWWNQSPTRFKRLFANNEAFSHFVQGSFDENEFVYGVNRVPWTAVRKVVSDESMALVYAPAIFILPRTFFANAGEWPAFLERATAHVAVPTRSPAASILKTTLLWITIIVAIIILWSVSKH